MRISLIKATRSAAAQAEIIIVVIVSLIMINGIRSPQCHGVFYKIFLCRRGDHKPHDIKYYKEDQRSRDRAEQRVFAYDIDPQLRNIELFKRKRVRQIYVRYKREIYRKRQKHGEVNGYLVR